jgi:hypothetical protein
MTYHCNAWPSLAQGRGATSGGTTEVGFFNQILRIITILETGYDKVESDYE